MIQVVLSGLWRFEGSRGVSGALYAEIRESQGTLAVFHEASEEYQRVSGDSSEIPEGFRGVSRCIKRSYRYSKG